jgi:hypothetical protein
MICLRPLTTVGCVKRDTEVGFKFWLSDFGSFLTFLIGIVLFLELNLTVEI